MHPTPIVVLDNGASTIKTNVVVADEVDIVLPEPRTVTNAIVRQTKGDKKIFFGHEFDRCKDFATLHYRLPFERGYLTDWDAQKAIWDGLFSSDCLKITTSEASLLITEPYFNLPNIQEQYDQFVFEEYEFQSYYRCTPASLIPYGSLFHDEASDSEGPPECMLIVDSGYSFTHVVPVMSGKVIWRGVRRLDIGGKLLTNHLKELLSLRQYDLMGETYITNDIKEKCCYVSTNYKEDMESSRFHSSKIVQEYILPKYSEGRAGRVKLQGEQIPADEDVVRMNTERFSVPEVLFRPTDIGLDQAGLSSTIADSISSLPGDVQGLFWANIGVVGGNAVFAGFRQRLYVISELRSLAPVEYEVRVFESSNPITAAYFGGAEYARQPGFANVSVTRTEYQEAGSNACIRKFRNGTWQAKEVGDEVPQGAGKEAGRSRVRSRVGKPQLQEADIGIEKQPLRSSRSRMATKG
ncbi:actin-like protein ARP6 [Fomitiporia mediterranea MF3/22]|uniref:actin-like protein ARP6 n=1 Tax=Fomitiporia mediterranea (strain MF3/22) TaxID=694068 RepID=UPI0004407413|nr:actin-like protein ARP6 [Fomitiporia mediterranea MF3/22]EJC98960.1 actin-like protein ARP6 [Fomitiporia mediterranea MF3/22]